MHPKNSKMKLKIIAIIAAVAIITVGVISFALYSRNLSDDKRLLIENAILDRQSVKPGENTEVFVTVLNASDENDAVGVSVKVSSTSLDISIEREEVNLGILGPGGSRRINFPISVQEEALEGRYRIKIETFSDQPFEGVSKDVYLEVERGN